MSLSVMDRSMLCMRMSVLCAVSFGGQNSALSSLLLNFSWLVCDGLAVWI